MTHPVILYILGYLANLGETDWHETAASDPDHGVIELQNAAGDILSFRHRFNSGDPQWFIDKRPKRWRGNTILDGLYPLYSPPKATEEPNNV